MDAPRFDRLTRALTTAGSRRRALGGLLLGSLGLLGSHRDEASAKKKKPCPPCKKRKKGKCKAKLPDGTACSGGTCQGGSCVTASVVPPPAPPPPPVQPIDVCAGRDVCAQGNAAACGPPGNECYCWVTRRRGLLWW